jgi:hypothetical protein
MIQAVIFDYGGVIRRDSREAYDAVDVAQGLARGTLWEVFHDIPEYRLSRKGTIDRDTFRAAIRRVLSQHAGEARADSALAAFDAHRLRCRRWTPTCGGCSSSCAPPVV